MTKAKETETQKQQQRQIKRKKTEGGRGRERMKTNGRKEKEGIPFMPFFFELKDKKQREQSWRGMNQPLYPWWSMDLKAYFVNCNGRGTCK